MAVSAGGAFTGYRLQVVSELRLWVAGNGVAIPEGSKRLLVLVALRGRRMRRPTAARLLWPDVGGKRAAGNLRSAIWRLRCAGADLFGDDPGWLELDPRVSVDLDELLEAALSVRTGSRPADLRSLLSAALAALDLLPGWYDDWLLLEKERVTAEIMIMIETLAHRLTAVGQYADAVEAALTMVAQDPLREGAQVALLTAHLREGNLCEARRSFIRYQRMLHDELGVHPSDQLLRLVGWRRPGPQRGTRSQTTSRAAGAGARTCVGLTTPGVPTPGFAADVAAAMSSVN
jgi:DNA-binding SARP family transcriptional activator